MAHDVVLVAGKQAERCPVTRAVCDVIAATGVEVGWQPHGASSGALAEETIAAAREAGVLFMPYIPTNRAAGQVPPIVGLRKSLGVFANVRPAQSLPRLDGRFEGVDLLVVRETTEDLYASMEHESIPGVYESIRVTTESACERIARFAFELARSHGRRKVTIVHKANILKRSDGLFMRTGQRVAAEFPEIECEECIVDALCMKLILYPERFDVLLCGNLFGDIVGDIASGLVGCAANSPSINVGEGGTTVFTCGHGDVAEVAWTEQANPLSPLLAATHMLRHLGEANPADRLASAIRKTLEDDVRPLALGGQFGATAFAGAVVARLEAAPSR